MAVETATTPTNDAGSPSVKSSTCAATTTATTATTVTNKFLKLRLWMVRHGESEANLKGVIAGQQDAPLTDLGVKQARALRQSHWFTTGRPNSFWRIYSSDLSRAFATAKNLLISNTDEGNDDSASIIILDRRLREKAYGARERCNRAMDYEECVQHWKDRGEPVPPLETEEDIRRRACSWLNEVIQQSVDDQATDTAASCTSNGSGDDSNNNIVVRDVLVVAHAGFIRNILRHVVGDERLKAHPNSTFDTDHEKRFLIPNTSLNLLELVFFPGGGGGSSSSTEPLLGFQENGAPMDPDKAIIVVLNWADHLNLVDDSNETVKDEPARDRVKQEENEKVMDLAANR